MASKATADQPSPAAQDKQRMQQVQFILPPELAVSGSSEGSSVREQDYDDHQMEDGASDQVCTRNSKKKGHPLVVQFATPTSSSRRGIQEEDGPRGSICDELLESGSTKILTIPVGGSNYKRREYEQELPARRETTQENKNQTNEESSRGLHNSASLWIIIWVLNNLAITLTNKVAYNEPVDFKYPYFLSAHHMAFIAMGTNFVFWCLERHSMEPSEEEDAAGVEEVELHAMEDWPSELESVATIQTSMEDTDSSCKQGSDRDNQSGSKGSKERKIEQDVVLQQKLLLLQPKVTQEKPSKTKQPPSWITTLFGDLEKKELDAKGKRLILAYSVLFSANLCIGNVSLIYVSVNFNQVMRSLVPAVTIFMGYFINKPTSFQRQIAVIPVIVGVAMACFGDMSFSTIGFGYTSLCVFLAALKVVASGEILTGDLKLHPFDLLRHMTPLALVQCLIMSIATGEVQEILQRWPTDFSPWGPKGLYPSSIVNLTGLISLTFNVSSLQVNKLTSPLTLCVAANVKQVLMIGIATAVFETEISPLNAVSATAH
uniref:Sugar phosphate transporter domain-containing protein n=1 Tax=Entomoneis paludosa TaxID=265537 RepID=A0A7S3DTQ7_9STRA|mmetsp:Transcript_3642/g.7596  ORF Transcript_3642/g.7596 Transcript_3642/m.7596 type:complete len:545 (+) Transcript_3642:112-1746(+)